MLTLFISTGFWHWGKANHTDDDQSIGHTSNDTDSISNVLFKDALLFSFSFFTRLARAFLFCVSTRLFLCHSLNDVLTCCNQINVGSHWLAIAFLLQCMHIIFLPIQLFTNSSIRGSHWLALYDIVYCYLHFGYT